MSRPDPTRSVVGTFLWGRAAGDRPTSSRTPAFSSVGTDGSSASSMDAPGPRRSGDGGTNGRAAAIGMAGWTGRRSASAGRPVLLRGAAQHPAGEEKTISRPSSAHQPQSHAAQRRQANCRARRTSIRLRAWRWRSPARRIGRGPVRLPAPRPRAARRAVLPSALASRRAAISAEDRTVVAGSDRRQSPSG